MLPRFGDHAADLAYASSAGTPESFTCDFAHAFMTVPASAAEARWNCCQVEEPLHRDRPALDAAEPMTGLFLIWLVLGFGGKAFPLLYARVALVLPRLRPCPPTHL